MKYQVVIATNPREFEELVTGQLAAGWICQGGVSVCAVFETQENTRKGYTEHNTDYTYAQAMIQAPEQWEDDNEKP